MKLTVDQLRAGDKLRFPDGSAWEVGCIDHKSKMFRVLVSEIGWMYNGKVASILSAVEVERKPEKVTFRAVVRDWDTQEHVCMVAATGPDGTELRGFSLEPFIGQEVEVEVRPLATKGGSNG